jgi:hypothetical protein
MIRALRILSLSVVALWLWQVSAYAAPGDILFEDDFDAGAGCSTLGPQWTTSSTNLGGLSTQTSNSGNCSAFTRGGAVTLQSQTVDLSSVVGATLTSWIRLGADSFSEDIDTNENLVVEYFNASAVWTQITTELGAGVKGSVINLNFELPLDALHSGFRVRFRQTGGSGGPPANGGVGYDYWHIDDVVLTETGLPPTPELPSGMGVGLCERFESGFGNWTATNNGRSGVNSDTFSSANNSMYLRRNTVTTTSIAFDSDSLDEIEVWVRRGSDAFSENPENGEDLSFQYLNAANAWITLETFFGNGAQGEIFERTYTIPTSAWHANFRVRFNLNSGSGTDFDYWHVDDLCFNRAQPDFTVTKDVRIEQDPINGTTNPLMIPGAWAIYTFRIENNGRGRSDLDTLAIGDDIDSTISLFTGDFDGFGSPFEFIDGIGSSASGVSLNFTSLGDGADGVTFRNASDVSITPNGNFDPLVASFFLEFDGEMNAAVFGQTPVFEIEYRVRVE